MVVEEAWRDIGRANREDGGDDTKESRWKCGGEADGSRYRSKTRPRCNCSSGRADWLIELEISTSSDLHSWNVLSGSDPEMLDSG